MQFKRMESLAQNATFELEDIPIKRSTLIKAGVGLVLVNVVVGGAVIFGAAWLIGKALKMAGLF